MIPIHALIRRHHEILQTEIDGEVVAMSLVTGRSFGMDGSASRIWRLLEQPHRVVQLVQQMAAGYDVKDLGQCGSDVRSFIEDLVANQLAVVSEESAADSARE